MSVTIVGTVDARIEELVCGVGPQATACWVADFAALAAPGARPSDVLLIDMRRDSHLSPTLALFKKQHPATGVILLLATLDPALMLEAMRAGVSECVAEPLGPDDLTDAVARVIGQREASAPGAVFAFVGARGGVGTTTTAVNVATSLARLSPRAVLLIDLHPVHGEAAVFLGVEARYSVLDAVENLHRLDAAIFRSLIIRTASGLDLLASGPRAGTAPVTGADLRSVIALAATQYAYTVLDVSRSDGVALDALDHVSTIVVVANQELATVRNAGRIAVTLRARYPRARVITALSRPDRQADIDQQDIERAVGSTITHQFPNDYRRAVTAVNSGRPLILDAPTALSAAFASLARDLAGLTPSPSTSTSTRRSNGLRGLLSGRS